MSDIQSPIAQKSSALQDTIAQLIKDREQVGPGPIADALATQEREALAEQAGLVLKVLKRVSTKLTEKVDHIREVRQTEAALTNDIAKLDAAKKAFLDKDSPTQGNIPVLEKSLAGLVNLSGI